MIATTAGREWVGGLSGGAIAPPVPRRRAAPLKVLTLPTQETRSPPVRLHCIVQVAHHLLKVTVFI